LELLFILDLPDIDNLTLDVLAFVSFTLGLRDFDNITLAFPDFAIISLDVLVSNDIRKNDNGKEQQRASFLGWRTLYLGRLCKESEIAMGNDPTSQTKEVGT